MSIKEPQSATHKKQKKLMKTSDRHPSSKRLSEKFFVRKTVKNLFLLFVFCILFSACFKNIMRPLESREIGSPSYKMIKDAPLSRVLSYLRLTERDLGVEFQTKDNDFFQLEKVDVLLKHPLQIESYADYLTKRIEDGTVSLEKLLSLAVSELEIDSTEKNNQVLPSAYLKHDYDNLFPLIDKKMRDEIVTFISITARAHLEMNEAFSLLSPRELVFLKHYFSEMILMDKLVFAEGMTPHAHVPSQVSLKRDEHYVLDLSFDLASRIDRAKFYHASLTIAAAVDTLLTKKNLLRDTVSPNSFQENTNLRGDIIAYEETPFGTIIIGGKEATYYNNITPLLIIDLGGDDEYHNIAPFSSAEPIVASSSTIIDFGGNDIYRSDRTFVQGSGNFGFSCLVDYSGNDTYLSHDFSQGCGFFGVGILYDRQGDDRYRSDVMAQGAAAFGVGLLCDLEGNDSYFGNLYNQGLGFVGGLGLLIDADGNDTFAAGEKYPDFREPDRAFDSFSQGFGLGYRNYGSGGIGVLWDAQGNDRYKSSYFSQGSSYWRAIGLLIDSAGSDTYEARRYAQGAGTHSTVGALIDESGNDTYTSWGISQGCGYDYSQGMLFDKNGDDTYRAEWFSQGTSGVAGVGMLIDTYGDDIYLCEPFNSQGSGQYSGKEESGSVGLLLDLQGKDTYSNKGQNNSLWRQGHYGGGIDACNAVWHNTVAHWLPDALILKGKGVLPQKRPPMPASIEPLPELEKPIENEDHRKMVVQQLSERGPSIIPLLLDYLVIEDRQLELMVTEILLKMGRNALPPLLAVLDDPTTMSSLTTSLLAVLGEMEDEAALSPFLSFLNAEDPEHRKMAMRGLSRLKDFLPLDEVLRCADDTNPAVRKYCARALEGNESHAALKVLTRLLADDHFTVRFAASESLSNTGSSIEPYLLQVLDDAQSYPPYARDLARDLLEGLRSTHQ
jgi:hypothetical protein